MVRRSIAFVIFLGFGIGVARAHMDEPPAGLTVVDWAQIRALYERHRHSATLDEDGAYVARNPEQGWTIRFDGRGFLVRPDEGDWRWGLELVGFGGSGAPQAIEGAAPTVTAEHERVRYGWRPDLEEWFVNYKDGLEQGWTVGERPAGGEGLELVLRVRGGLRPEAEEGGSEVRFLDDAGVAVVRYDRLQAWDATGRVLPSHMTVDESGRVRIAVEDRGARYPVTIDPVAVQTAYIKASNTGAGDEFGRSVALSGDTVAVGAWWEDSSGVGVNSDSQADNSASNSGAVYVFQRIGGLWAQQAYIKASNTGLGFGGFGSAVALSGDTLAVGAPTEGSSGVGVNSNTQTDNSAGSSGAVYVFQRTGGVWAQQAYIKASNTGARDAFGSAVALAGDTLAVGAYGEDSNGVGVNSNTQIENSVTDSGAVYVFQRTGGMWAQQAYIKASNTGSDDLFGHSVALSGDTLAVGAWREGSNGVGVNSNAQADNSKTESGAVYIFQRTEGVWTQQAYIKASNTGASDAFGYSVALSGDTLAVGALFESSNGVGVNSSTEDDNSVAFSGAAYVFQRTGVTWTQQAYLKASNTRVNGSFGYSVALSGDTLAVGAPNESNNAVGVNPNTQTDYSASQSGAVYVFQRMSSAWAQQAYIKASNAGFDDNFGRSVALSGGTLAVGAWWEDSSGVGVNSDSQADNSTNNSGAAYVFGVCEFTTTAIDQVLPSPSPPGETYRVHYTVSNVCGDVILGTVIVSDGEGAECSASTLSGSCELPSAGLGTNTLTVSYLGYGTFAPSSDSTEHQVQWATTTMIDSISPSTAVAGAIYTLAYTVTSAGGIPPGSVTVSDGSSSNSCSAAGGSCSLTSLTAGEKTITASYVSEGDFAGSGDMRTYTVNPAPTTTIAGQIVPNPSQVGASYDVGFAVTSAFGTPTGSVLVSEGEASKACLVSAGSCLLTSATAGAKTITVSYFGDGNFAPSSDAGAHTVNPASTSTVVGAISPSFPLVGEPYAVPYAVSSAGGTPTGSVTVSDGTESNTCNVADGSCSLTSATIGVKTLSVSYLGDGNFAPSSGAGAVQICSYALSPVSNALTAVGGSGAIVVTAPSGCPWTAGEALPWLSIISGASGVGSGTIGYQVDPNSDVLARSGNIVVADQTHAVTQSGVPCSYSITPATNSLGAVGGSGAIFVTTPPTCAWTVSESLSWVTIVSGASGSGDGTVAYEVSAFAQAGVRQGDITVAGKTHAITQAGGATLASELGAFTNGAWFLDRNGDFAFDGASEISGWGSPGDIPVKGDWNGDGFRDLGVYSNGTWFLDRNGDAAFDPATDIQGWGAPGWIPVTGDWNGDGKTDIGAIDPATSAWFLDLNGDFAFDPATEVRGWGSPGDKPVVGDWDGDGDDDIGVFSGGTWFIDFNGDRGFQLATDQRGWGVAGWIPVVGDWNGDGADEIGAIEPTSMAWFRDVNGDFLFDPATELIGWGSPGDQPVVADWNGDGADDVGVFSGGTWFIDAAGDGAFDPATDIRGWGVAGWTPVPGAWQ